MSDAAESPRGRGEKKKEEEKRKKEKKKEQQPTRLKDIEPQKKIISRYMVSTT